MKQTFLTFKGFWAKPSRMRPAASKMRPKGAIIASQFLLGAENGNFLCFGINYGFAPFCAEALHTQGLV